MEVAHGYQETRVIAVTTSQASGEGGQIGSAQR
jgi:hypothetical protein